MKECISKDRLKPIRKEDVDPNSSNENIYKSFRAERKYLSKP
jgi:hypothetical protein